jgi:hypothetical protein
VLGFDDDTHRLSTIDGTHVRLGASK